jgi:hypothetical protein
MPVRQVPGRDVSYHLISYDKNGRERQGDPDGTMSDRAAAAVADMATDVFIMSHGWKGDVPAAVEQYDRWTTAMLDCETDREQIRQRRPGFKAVLVGFHWPSLPFGDEELGGDGSFSLAMGELGASPVFTAVDQFVETYADRIADTPRARAALRTIFEHAMVAPPVVPSLPPEMIDAYQVLDAESGMGSGGPGADPGSDREPFDADAAYHRAVADVELPGVSFGGGFGLSSVLSPLRQLSFWRMKDRARHVGETAGFPLLERLMRAVPAARDVRFHLMGHSFGCIVVTSMVKGPGTRAELPRPVSSMTLVQGATSLWGFCNQIPDVGAAGYFWPVIDQKKVAGPILTTASVHDTAVGRLYPLAAGIARQTSFAPGQLPKYGGIGSHGIQGPGIAIADLLIESHTHAYGFQNGHVYNLECSSVINEGGGASGAHSDIAKPAVAHAMWEAVNAR